MPRKPELAERIRTFLEEWPYEAPIYDDWIKFKGELQWYFRRRILDETED